MTTGGWLFMLASLAFVWGLAAWCVHRWLQPPDTASTERGERRGEDPSGR